jgi:hypothetical protein
MDAMLTDSGALQARLRRRRLGLGVELRALLREKHLLDDALTRLATGEDPRIVATRLEVALHWSTEERP